MQKHKIVILLGSGKDMPFANGISQFLEREHFFVEYEYSVASAHKTTKKLIDKLEAYEQSDENIVYITVAGLSDALSGVVAGYSKYPVIACPPDSERFGWSKIFSSMITPEGVPVLFVAKPENAALAAVKILALSNHSLLEEIKKYQKRKEAEVIEADKEIKEKKTMRVKG
jgi:5-(carboxyamino)imidazole ribonucleotide mutase